MKKIVVFLLALVMSISLCACGSGNDEKKEDEGAVLDEEQKETETVMSNDSIMIEGVYADDSYRDDDESPLRIVYLFYTINANDSNLQVDTNNITMTINESNAYTAEHIPGMADNTPSFYYSSYLEDVYTGTSLKMVSTFKVPEGDLAAGKTITLSDHQIPEIDAIHFATDDIQHFNSAEEIAQAADPEGYAQFQTLKQPADEARTKEVKNQINGYYYQFYVNSTSYKLEFWADNNFELTTAFGTNGGTYTVANGYVICTYSSNNAVVEIPYTLENGEIDLDVVSAFDVKGN